MPTADLPFHTLTDLAARLARGETTSREIVAACLAGSRRATRQLHAFVDVYRDDALDARRGRRPRAQRPDAARGPLHGLPIALKDLLHIAGRQTTAGSKSWLGRVSDITATAVDAPGRRGHDPARQDAHGRVRVRRLGPQRADGRAVESVGPGHASRRRRLVERLGRGGGRGPRAGGASAPTPAARCAFRRRCAGSPGLKTDVRPREPVRRRAAVDDARLDRPARAQRRRRRAADRRDGGPRSARSGARSACRTSTSPPRWRAEPDVRGMRIAALAPEQFPGYVDPDVVRARDAAIDVLRELGADVEEVRVADRLRRHRGARGQAARGRGVRVPSRAHRGRVAADRPVGAQARAGRARRSAPPTTSTI